MKKYHRTSRAVFLFLFLLWCQINARNFWRSFEWKCMDRNVTEKTPDRFFRYIGRYLYSYSWRFLGEKYFLLTLMQGGSNLANMGTSPSLNWLTSSSGRPSSDQLASDTCRSALYHRKFPLSPRSEAPTQKRSISVLFLDEVPFLVFMEDSLANSSKRSFEKTLRDPETVSTHSNKGF